MASGNISRYKNLGSYISNMNARLSQSERNRSAFGGISASAITSTHLAGEVILDDNVIQSSNYARGISGWAIDANGSAEFSDVFVRGNINANSGTIGVWNLSSQATGRTFDIETYSASGAVTNTNVDGSYSDTVTYTLTTSHSLIIGDFVTITGIVSEDNTSATSGLGFNIINGEIKSVTSNTITVYSAVRDVYTSGTGLVSKVYAGTFIENVDLGFDDSNATDGTYVGLYTSENLKTSGLYIRDYEKRYLDYGYFSSNGVAYTSAAVQNLIWNPSGEYFSSTLNTVTNTVVGWTSTSTTAVNTYDFTGSQAANPGLDAIQRMFTAYSAYGIIAGWDTTARTDYTTATIDYKAGDNYNLFDRTKPVYLTFDLYPLYQPVVANVTSMTWWSNTVVKVNATNTFAAGDTLFADFQAYNNGAINNTILNQGDTATVLASPAPTSSTFWVGIPASNPQSGYNNAVSTIAKTYTLGVSTLAFTVTAMGLTFTAGQGVQIIVPSGTLAGTYYGTIAAGPTSTTFTVTWTVAPSASGTIPVGTTFTGDPIAFLDSLRGGSTFQVYKKYDWYLRPNDIQLQFDSSNSNTITSISNVISSGVSFSNPATYKIDGAAFLANYVNNKPSFAKTISISLDPSKIASEYLRLAPTRFANANTVTLNMPNWLYKDSAYTTKWVQSASDYVSANISFATSSTYETTYTVSNQFRVGQIVSISGVHTTAPDSGQFNLKDVQVTSITGTVGSATAFGVNVANISGTFSSSPSQGTAIGRIGYVLDNVSLSPENRFFYGSSGLNSTSSPYSWYTLGSGTTAPSQASIEAPKSWINVDLLGQSAVLNYWDYIGFKTSSTGYSGNMFSSPSISTIPTYTDFNFSSNSTLGNQAGYMINANSSSVLSLSGGVIEWNTGGDAFERYDSYINSAVSKSAAGVEMVAKKTTGSGGSFDNLFGAQASASVYVDDFGGDTGAVGSKGAGVFQVIADSFRVFDDAGMPSIQTNFNYTNSFDQFGMNQILQVSANVSVTTTNTSTTSSPSPTLEGIFYTPASGMSMIALSAWMTSNNANGNAYGTYAIYEGKDNTGVLKVASSTNSDISGAILVQGTNTTSVVSNYVFVGSPNTQYYIVCYFYTNATYTATISRRRILVTPII